MKDKINEISICILRLSALGDVSHVLPVINAIKRHYPQARISWIIDKPGATLLKDLPGVEFIVLDKQGGPGAVWTLRQALKQLHFDILLHMQVSARANLLSLLVKAKRRIGWDKPRCRDGHQWFINESVLSVSEQHQVDAFLEFARALDIPRPQVKWQFPVAEGDLAWAGQQLGNGAPILMISPCSSHPQRNWSASHYAMIADYAIEKLAMRVVLIGGPSGLEKHMGKDIMGAMQGTAINLIGKDSIRQSVALLKLADVVLSPDSGPVHLASAVGTPVIGLYAATPSKRSGPYRSLDLCVDKYAEAAYKFRKSPPTELRWGQRIEVDGVMELITSDDVVAKLEMFATKT